MTPQDREALYRHAARKFDKDNRIGGFDYYWELAGPHEASVFVFYPPGTTSRQIAAAEIEARTKLDVITFTAIEIQPEWTKPVCSLCNGAKVVHTGNLTSICPGCNGQFKPTNVLTPPMLVSMIGIGLDQVQSRYFALYYAGTCATWDDGRSSASFNFFHVYQPLTEHMTVQIALLECGERACFGADDMEPTHALLCDRDGGPMWVGPIRQVINFARDLNGHPTPQQQQISAEVMEQLMSQINDTITLQEAHSMGMFEMFGQPSEQMQRHCAELLRFLGKYLTPDLYQRYQACNNPMAQIFLDWHIERAGGSPHEEGLP